MKKICFLIPCYNEQEKIGYILEELFTFNPFKIVVLNDCSTDRSLEILKKYQKKYKNLTIVNFKKNVGVSKVKITGFAYFQNLLNNNEIENEDYLIKLDGDGQHSIKDVKRLIDFMEKNNYDFILTNRDLKRYPFYKKFGNLIFRLSICLFSFRYIPDPMSGLKMIKMKLLNRILKYFQGFKYSAAQEISLILSKDKKSYFIFNIDIDEYISGAQFYNGFKVILGMLACFFRIILKYKYDPLIRVNNLLNNKNIEIIG